MPRAKAPPKKDLLKQHLADALGVDLTDILTRPQVISEYGEELGYTNEKSLSNAAKAARDGDAPPPPCFYRAPLGKEGWALYSRRDLWLWLHDPKARREMEDLKEKGRPHHWPAAASNPTPPHSSKSDSEVFLDRLTDDEDYKEKALGRRP